MRALLSRSAGGPETLVVTELPDPVPGAGEVLITVKACGVNYPDALIIQDQYQYKPARPFSPGAEIAGVVSGVGEGVDSFETGDRVLALLTWGGMAEKVTVAATRVARLPANMPFEVGAAFLITYGTSYHALKDRARLQAGETLLVLGAAGGVGLAAVELGKAMGARVIAAASTPEKLQTAIARGASHGIVYPTGPFDSNTRKALTKLFKDACAVEGADVIYDPVGGDYSEAALRAIAWEGRHLVVGFPAGIARIPLNLPLLKGCQILGVFSGAFITRRPEANAANTRELLDLYARKHIRPEISARFPLSQGGQAIARLAAREAIGKIVVTLDSTG